MWRLEITKFVVNSGGIYFSVARISVPADLDVCENRLMTGVQFVTDRKGRKVAVLIDLKRHGARLQDFWDGLISESRRKETGISLGKVKADLAKRGRLRG